MRILGMIFLILGLAIFANAQKVLVSGIVTDQPGAIIPDVKIIVISQRGEKFETRTNNQGKYRLEFPFYKLGNYKIKVEEKGFKPLVKEFKFASRETRKKVVNLTLISKGKIIWCPEDVKNSLVEETEVKTSNDIQNRPLEEFRKENSNKTLNGVIYDANKKKIPHVQITAINENGNQFKTETNKAGEFSIKLPKGIYRIKLHSEGFKLAIYKNFNLAASTKYEFVLEKSINNHFPLLNEKNILIKKTETNVSSNIQKKPLEKIPKENNKNKRKKNNK